MATSVLEFLARIRQARADVARLKAQIRSTREELGAAAAVLRGLEVEALRLGVAIVNQPEIEGVGGIRGQ